MLKTEVRALSLYDLEWVEQLVSEHFGSPRVVSRGVLYEVRDLAGLVATTDGARAGLLQYHAVDRHLEVVTLIAVQPRRGIGQHLLEAVEPIARAQGCTRIWLITTNNNVDAISFYRAIGWEQVATHHGAVNDARRLKPEIPTHDGDGRRIEDELEFERRLSDHPTD